MTYSMFKGLQCIIGRFRTGVAILKFSNVRELFTYACLKIDKHGDSVGDQRIMGLIYYIYFFPRGHSNEFCNLIGS